jgi:hypothetical protein
MGRHGFGPHPDEMPGSRKPFHRIEQISYQFCHLKRFKTAAATSNPMAR